MILRVLRVALLVPLMGGTAFAVPTRWTLSNVTLGDGSRIVGSFDYDADTNTWSRLAITTSGGSIVPATNGWEFNTLYSGGLRNDGTRSGFVAVYPSGADLTGAKALVLMSTDSQYMTNAGGTISLEMFRGGTCGESDCSVLMAGAPSTSAGSGAFASAGSAFELFGNWSGGSEVNVYWAVRGTEFSVQGADLSVTHLGYYDSNADGLQESMRSGCHEATGALLASLTVPAGDTAGWLAGFAISPCRSPWSCAATSVTSSPEPWGWSTRTGPLATRRPSPWGAAWCPS